MNDPLIARFAEACGATGPLDLRVGLAEGGVLAEGSVRQPFTLVGRDDSCDVTLSDPEVHLRHAWLQVVDGRVFAIDLGSRTGLGWPSGLVGPGWLDVDSPVRVGPFQIQLRSHVSTRPVMTDLNPLQSDATINRSRPAVQLDFRNGKRAKDKWSVNRMITLIGRSEACKIHLNADDISNYHCGLVLTPSGLWVVDLSGRGVVVSGERMRVAPLPHGAELWVGRFLVSCRYPANTDILPAGRSVGAKHPKAVALDAHAPAAKPAQRAEPAMAATRVASIVPLIAEDEVALGGLPIADSLTGLPSSHIMFDAFRPAASSGPISAPIMVSGSHPIPTLVPVERPSRSTGRDSNALNAKYSSPGRAEADQQTADALVASLQQLGEMHGQMFDQIHQSLSMLSQLSGQLRGPHAVGIRQELSRIRELNGELATLQTEVARVAFAQALGGIPAEASLREIGTSDRTPIPSDVSGRASEAIQDWIRERVGNLQRERQNRWHKLAGLFAASTSPV